MCGITGWINFSDNIADKRNIIRNMAETLKDRGPDDEGFYYSSHALLGHRRLTVVDPKGGHQPMIKVIDGRKYVIVYNGELYNTEDVRRELLKKGYEFNSYSDTEVLLTSYIEWGEECLNHINGIYAFGIWDENAQKLFLVRDPLGVKPIFYSFKDGSFLFGSEMKAILAFPGMEAVIDRQGLLEIFGLGPARIPGSGVFKDIHEIPPAFYLTFSRDGITLKEYWKLKCEKHLENADETAEHVKILLTDAIERQLVSDVPVCTFLSGGLDSSAISAVASKKFREEGKTLDTYSIDYEDNDKYFKSDDFQPDPDSKWTDVVSKYIKSSHHNVINTSIKLSDSLTDAAYANDLPGMADVDSSLYLFCKEVRKNATVALSGECADELFGGYPWYMNEDFINTDTFPWSLFVKERESIMSKEFKNLNLEEFARNEYKKSISRVPHLEDDSKRDIRMRELFYLNIKWFMITLLTRKDRMSMANSLEVRVPFADYRIVEYAFNIPSSIKFYEGREKGILRKALVDILPKGVIYRKKSPYPKTHNPDYTGIVSRWLLDILNDPSSPILQVIDKDVVTDIAESGGASFTKPWFGQLMKGPQLIAYLIQMNAWMKKYKVKIIK